MAALKAPRETLGARKFTRLNRLKNSERNSKRLFSLVNHGKANDFINDKSKLAYPAREDVSAQIPVGPSAAGRNSVLNYWDLRKLPQGGQSGCDQPRDQRRKRFGPI